MVISVTVTINLNHTEANYTAMQNVYIVYNAVAKMHW